MFKRQLPAFKKRAWYQTSRIVSLKIAISLLFSGLFSFKTPQSFETTKPNMHSLLIARTYLLCISKLHNARRTTQIAPGLKRKCWPWHANQRQDSNPRLNRPHIKRL